jgi:hypothetical protein
VTAAQDANAGGSSGGDMLDDAVTLGHAGQRADVCVLIQRISDSK